MMRSRTPQRGLFPPDTSRTFELSLMSQIRWWSRRKIISIETGFLISNSFSVSPKAILGTLLNFSNKASSIVSREVIIVVFMFLSDAVKGRIFTIINTAHGALLNSFYTSKNIGDGALL